MAADVEFGEKAINLSFRRHFQMSRAREIISVLPVFQSCWEQRWMVCGSYFCLRNLLWCVDSWLRFLQLDFGTAFQCNRLFCRGTSSLIVEDSMADRMKYAWNFQNPGEQWNRRQTVRNRARRQRHRCLFQIRFLGFWNIIVLRRDRTKFNKVSLIFTVFSAIWRRCVIKSKSQKWRDSHARRPWCLKLFAMKHKT